jgi:hypothetical protein
MIPPNAARQVDRVARLDPGRRARAHPANTESVHADLIYTHASPHGEDLVVAIPGDAVSARGDRIEGPHGLDF